MKIEAKPRTLVKIGLAIVILVGGHFYMKKTAPARRYKAEIKQLRMIDEHQSLDIKVYKQKIELEAIRRKIAQRGAQGKPTYKLTPKEDPNQ